jgi:type IV pilus assembly protein PilO
MTLSDINNLDFSNVGGWPLPVKIAAVILLCAGVAGLGYWFDTQHQLDALERARNQEPQLRATFEQRQVRAANLQAYRDQLDEMRQSFGAMLRQLPNEAEVAGLLEDISQTGLASGLEFELFRPESELLRDFYAELPITIRVTGDYHEFGEFASRIAALPRIVTLHNLSLRPASGQNARLTMEVTAKTYRYLEAGEQP